MTEDELSLALYRLGVADSTLEVISWQGVSGKAYFTLDVQLRLRDGSRVVPDLVVLSAADLFVVEIKATHAASKDQDEPKLKRLMDELGNQEIRRQVLGRLNRSIGVGSVTPVVAYGDDVEAGDGCERIAHLSWARHGEIAATEGLASVIIALQQ